jgi:hypothetical protein
MKRLGAVVLAVATLLPIPATARSGQPRATSDNQSPPVSLKRIKRALQEAESNPPANRLRLSYYVAVIGENKRVSILKDFDAMHGPVPFSAPTHQELFEQVTPREFRPPAADLLGAAVWLGTKLAQKTVKK